MEDQNEIDLLASLGLTSCQARVYLCLVKSGMCTAKEISKASKITRQDVYRIIPRLHESGLVRKAITSPATFEAIPIEDGISHLLERRSEETTTLRLKTKELVNKYKQNTINNNVQGVESEFLLIPKGMAIAKKRALEIEHLQESLDIIISFSRYLPSMIDNSEGLLKALNRGVRVRHVTEKPVNTNNLPKNVWSVWQHPFFSIRFTMTQPKSLVAVYDKKEVIISVSPHARLYKSNALWSNNPSLLEMAQEYFEKTWETAMEL